MATFSTTFLPASLRWIMCWSSCPGCSPGISQCQTSCSPTPPTPRFYSIASSGKVHPTSVHICGVVVEYKVEGLLLLLLLLLLLQIPDGRTNKGVATTWLKNKLPVGEGEERVCPKVGEEQEQE